MLFRSILDPAQILRNGAGANNGAWDARVPLDEARVGTFSHVQVDAETDGDNGREEYQESHNLHVPNVPLGVAEAFQSDQNDGQGQGQCAQRRYRDVAGQDGLAGTI